MSYLHDNPAHPVDVSSDATPTEGPVWAAARRGGFPKWLGRVRAGRAGRRGCGGDAGTPSATGFGGEVCCAFDGEAEPRMRRANSTGGVVELAPRVAHIVRMLVGDNLLPHGCQSGHRLSRYHGYGSVEAKSLFEKIQKKLRCGRRHSGLANWLGAPWRIDARVLLEPRGGPGIMGGCLLLLISQQNVP